MNDIWKNEVGLEYWFKIQEKYNVPMNIEDKIIVLEEFLEEMEIMITVDETIELYNE